VATGKGRKGGIVHVPTPHYIDPSTSPPTATPLIPGAGFDAGGRPRGQNRARKMLMDNPPKGLRDQGSDKAYAIALKAAMDRMTAGGVPSSRPPAPMTSDVNPMDNKAMERKMKRA